MNDYVSGDGLDPEPSAGGEQTHAELIEADLIGQQGAGFGDRRWAESGPRHVSSPWPGMAGPARGAHRTSGRAGSDRRPR